MIRPGTAEQRDALDAGDLRMIAELWASPPKETLGTLPKPTRKNAEKGNCDVCGKYHGLPAVHLDYMGHADVTLALLDVDPEFTYEWLTNEDGSMLVRKPGNRLVLEGSLTVLGVTRSGVGTCESSKMEPEKELIGDLLRNCAMRFGIATALWSKSDAHESEEHDRPQPYRTSGAQPWDEPAKTEEPHPNAERVAAVLEEFSRLTEAQQAKIREWKPKNRSLSGKALLEDEPWLQIVETFLDELHDVAVGPSDTPLEAAESDANDLGVQEDQSATEAAEDQLLGEGY